MIPTVFLHPMATTSDFTKTGLSVLFIFLGFFRRNPRQILKPLRYSYLRHVKHLMLAEPDTAEANT